MGNTDALNTPACRLPRMASLGGKTPAVCRLGLATRGNTHLESADVRHAIDCGVNYLNWCGHVDGMSRAVSELSMSQREEIVVATQLSARDAAKAERELATLSAALNTDYIDVVTFYYVEHEAEWQRIGAAGGAMETLRRAVADGRVRRIGLTTHQRRLGARWLEAGRLDLLMVRYNAAHRGAETDVFPAARKHDVPVVAFTGLRWGALLKPTPDDPADFKPLPGPEWYRFVLAHPDVAVVLMAPNDRAELEANLGLLSDWRPPSPESMESMRAHGDRVRRHAGGFP